jgi:hypothetical protein
VLASVDGPRAGWNRTDLKSFREGEHLEMAQFRIPAAAVSEGQITVAVEASDLGAAIGPLTRYPGFRDRLLDDRASCGSSSTCTRTTRTSGWGRRRPRSPEGQISIVPAAAGAPSDLLGARASSCTSSPAVGR